MKQRLGRPVLHMDVRMPREDRTFRSGPLALLRLGKGVVFTERSPPSAARYSRVRGCAWIVLMSVSLQAHGTSILEFDRWMKDIERRALSLHRQMERQDVEGTTADAKELGALYEKMQQYFEQRSNAAQAIDLSRTGRAAVDAIVKHASRRDFDAALTNARQLTRECRTCHRVFKPLE